jgi:hypothetical protein
MRKTNKKAISLLCTAALLISLTACDRNPPEDEDIFDNLRDRNRPERTTTPGDVTGEPPTGFVPPSIEIGTLEQLSVPSLQFNLETYKFWTEDFLWRVNDPNRDHWTSSGMVDVRTGEIVVPMIYASVSEFCKKGFARVSTISEESRDNGTWDERWGIVDMSGTLVVRPSYTQIMTFDPVHGLAPVELNPNDRRSENYWNMPSRWGFINTRGEVAIPLEFDRVGWEGFGDGKSGLAPVGQQQGGCCCSTKWGFVNTRGVLVIPYIYSDVTSFRDGLARVSDGSGSSWLINASGERIIPLGGGNSIWWGGFGDNGLGIASESVVINTRGEIVFSIDYGKISHYANEGMFSVISWNDRFGFANSRGELVVPMEYAQTHSFNDGLAAVAVGRNNDWDNWKWGFVNTSGELAIPATFDSAGNFEGGVAPVSRNGKWGFINTRGEIIVPIENDSLGHFSQGFVNGFSIKAEWDDDNGGRYGIIDANNEIVLPLNFSYIVYVGTDEDTGRGYFWANIGNWENPRWRIYTANPA